MPVPADNPRVLYQGRLIVGSAHQVMMGFPGIVTLVKVNGTRLGVRISASSDDVYFNVSVDGAAPERIRLVKGQNDLELLKGAAPGVHTVELVRRTESWEGVCEVEGFEIGGGTLLEPAPLPARKLMFIGDSVTCGSGTEQSDVPGKPGAERSNAAASFGMKLAVRLGAQFNLVSYGGRGIFRDWQGITATNNAPEYYELALPDDPKTQWDHSTYVPDAIGICLGTNDFSRGIPDQTTFVNAFIEFLRKVRRDAPNAPIFLIDSPILNDEEGEAPKLTVCRAYLDEIVRRMDSPKVTHLKIKHYKGSPGDGHPTAAEHTLIADELEPAFRAVLHWDKK
ncbi:MAG TPA: GDSL-type esterase/lipase family protein [Opitutaceae bacterium]|nr:GDSL-type esterase/lipase family protein [Opitutaceae bacterium]